MIDWVKIQDSHIIKTSRKICNKWWGIDIQLYDEDRNCKSDNMQFQGPLCNLIHTTDDGPKRCLQSCRKHLKYLKKDLEPFVFKCHAGLYSLAVPLLAKGKYVGAVIGSGSISSKNSPGLSKYMKEIVKLGLDKATIKQEYGKSKTIDDHSEEYLVDFMKMVAEDVIVFYEMLHDEIDLIRKKSQLMENAYVQKYKGIIGISPEIKKVFETLGLIENSEIPILLEGESGTGKELVAAAIHFNSPRKDKMFVMQNCSVFSDTLLISELFGHEKGAFTGAISDKKGLFEIADGGTLFLDEIGDIDMKVQAKLLRVLENGSFYRLGGSEQQNVNVRIIAATNKKLMNLIDRGLFRKDLFYRINSVIINIPPLRDRNEDIIILANYFLENYSEAAKIEKKEISKEVMEILAGHDWPGNIRELKNLMQRTVYLSGNSKTIGPNHIPKEVLPANYSLSTVKDNKNGKKLKDALRSYEKEIIENSLKTAEWNKSVASRELGISRASLNNKIEQYNILK